MKRIFRERGTRVENRACKDGNDNFQNFLQGQSFWWQLANLLQGRVGWNEIWGPKYNLAEEPHFPYISTRLSATDHLSSAIGKARSLMHIVQFIDLEAVMTSVEQLYFLRRISHAWNCCALGNHAFPKMS
jgi:hypothetical protein